MHTVIGTAIKYSKFKERKTKANSIIHLARQSIGKPQQPNAGSSLIYEQTGLTLKHHQTVHSGQVTLTLIQAVKSRHVFINEILCLLW